MNANEGLGLLGWATLGLIALVAISGLLFGFSSLFYFAILLVLVVFVILLQLCGDKLEA
jgi:hypothetical protein